jgi:outer membrane protein assembly factor BamB
VVRIAWLTGFSIIAGAAASTASDWPQFRGDGGLGIAVDAAPPLEWGDGKAVKWKTRLPGPGSSSPIVLGNRVFVTCYSGFGTEGADAKDPTSLRRLLICVNRKDGAILWDASEKGVPEEDAYRGFISEHGYASSTPATDGERVYAFFGKAGVAAYDLQGKQLWRAEVGVESDPRRWGSAASPIVYRNLVIVNAASEGRAVFAFDKITGKQVWKAEGKRLALSFATPAIVRSSAGKDELVIAMPGEVWGLNPESGKLLWFATIRVGGNVSPSVVAADGVVYITGGFPERGSVAIRAGGEDDVTKSHVVWSIKEGSYVPTPIVHDGRLYWVSDTGIATCIDAATGKVIYEERLPLRGGGGGSKPVYASPVLAGGRLYAVSRTAGTFVLAAGATFRRIGVNTLGDDSDFNATPAVSGRQLFLRSNRFLYCIESEHEE